MSETMMVYILLVGGGFVLTAGDVVMKRWSETNDMMLFILATMMYVVALVMLGVSFKFKNMAAASALIIVFNLLTLTIISWWCFNEAPSAKQSVGLALASIAALLL